MISSNYVIECNMNLVPSVSRSSGLQDDGDKLKDLKFQEEYMSFIENKLQSYWQQYPVESHLTSSPDDKQKHAQHNILILFRKLREGIIASRRLDDFTLQVYQTSLNLSVIFRMPTQTTAIVAQLIPHRYKETGLYHSASMRTTPEHPSPSALAKEMATLSLQNSSRLPHTQKDRKTKPVYQPPHRRRGENPAEQKEPSTKPQAVKLASRIELAILISLFNTLIHEYPRQDSFHFLSRWFYCLDKGSFWRKNSPSFRYAKRLSEALVTNNLSRFEQLSREPSVDELFIQIMSSDDQTRPAERTLAQIAIMALVNDLRSKVHDTAWEILRAAYREADSIISGEWLSTTLILSVPPTDKSLSQKAKYIDAWFLNKPKIQVTPKEGVEGRWVLHH